MEQHFILCGLGRIGWRVLEYLQAAGSPVVVVDNKCAPDDPRLGQALLVQGDCRRAEVLEKAGLAKARGVLILTSEDLVSVSTALMVHSLNPEVRVIVRMFNQNLITRLGPSVQNVIALSTSALTAPLLAMVARTGESLGTFSLEDGRRVQVTELAIHAHSPLIGRTIDALTTENGVLPVAHFSLAGNRFLHDVDGQTSLAVHDRLVVCGESARLEPLLAQDHESLPELLWAGFLRRQWRVVSRTLEEMDLPVKICTTAFLSVIIMSVIIFRYGMKNDALVDAFYRTISLLATGADMRGHEMDAGGWQKAYVSFLRLVGTALTAAFTAIITNYLVRAHLGGALEVRRIPDSGHFIVCGLGNVGFRVVAELVRERERVVAIERARENPFISTTRRLGVAVIVGDATVPEVLKQAHAASARAVVAATNSELVNLEVGLLVRQLDSSQRVVLRITDPILAQTLRGAAQVRLSLSIAELAAPAFVAALIGDRVRSVFMIEGQLLAALDLVVQPLDNFLKNLPVRVLAIDYRLLPISLLDAANQPRKNLMEASLQSGDRLTAIIGLKELQRLLQREKIPREWAVDVIAFPEEARPVLAKLGIERTLGHLTRGQAEHLLAQLQRAQVSASVRQDEPGA